MRDLRADLISQIKQCHSQVQFAPNWFGIVSAAVHPARLDLHLLGSEAEDGTWKDFETRFGPFRTEDAILEGLAYRAPGYFEQKKIKGFNLPGGITDSELVELGSAFALKLDGRLYINGALSDQKLQRSAVMLCLPEHESEVSFGTDILFDTFYISPQAAREIAARRR